MIRWSTNLLQVHRGPHHHFWNQFARRRARRAGANHRWRREFRSRRRAIRECPDGASQRLKKHPGGICGLPRSMASVPRNLAHRNSKESCCALPCAWTTSLVHDGVVILNDCYNSNPDAARTMVDVLRDTPAKRRIAVLGEMLELGRWSESLHRDVGSYVAKGGIDVLVGIRGEACHLVDAARQAGLRQLTPRFFPRRRCGRLPPAADRANRAT